MLMWTRDFCQNQMCNFERAAGNGNLPMSIHRRHAPLERAASGSKLRGIVVEMIDKSLPETLRKAISASRAL
jgi:hypothetical protein